MFVWVKEKVGGHDQVSTAAGRRPDWSLLLDRGCDLGGISSIREGEKKKSMYAC